MLVTEREEQTYYYYLNGLKGIACLLIMMGHYLGLYKYAQSFTPSIRIIDIINNSLLSFLMKNILIPHLRWGNRRSRGVA